MRLPLAVAALLAAFCLPGENLQAQRPSAMQLFPSETVLLVRTPEARLLIDRFQQTSFYQMFRDPEMASFSDAISVAAADAYTEFIQESSELELSELLKLPQGEIAFAVVHRQGDDPGVVLLADFRDQAQVAQQLVKRIETAADENSMSVTTETLRNDEATVFRDGNNQGNSMAMVRRDTTFVVSSDREILQSVLDRWDGIAYQPVAEAVEEDDSDETDETDQQSKSDAPQYVEPLSANSRFSSTLRELAPGNEEPPHMLFYIDPLGMLKAVAGRETGMRIAMATFPALGIDGIHAFGGAMWFSTDKWDSLARGHLLLANPRAGVVKIARLETGNLTPPDFVPAKMENCMLLRKNATQLFDDIATLYDKFQYSGAFRKGVEENISENLGIDFEQEFVGNLDGQVMYVTGYDESGKAFGAQTSLAVSLKDRAAAEASLKKVSEKYPEMFEAETFGATEYYSVGPRQFRELPEEDRRGISLPVLGFLDNHLVMCQSEQLFQQMIEANEGTRPRLNASLQYRLINSRLERLVGGRPSSGLGYHDSEAALRHYHQMAASEESRERMREIAEFSPFVATMLEIMEQGELPPVETLLKYATPSGTVLIDTPTGWHMIGFSFKHSSE